MNEWNADLLSLSAHKFYGPKGIGSLYIRRGTRIDNLIHGGEQERGLRAGTENVPGTAGFSLAAEKMYKDMDDALDKMQKLHDQFIRDISGIEDIKINGGDVPYIISLSVKDVRAEVLLHALEDKGIYVSAGSACSSNRPAVSATLKAMKVEKWQLDSTIRISLSRYNTEDEMSYTADQLKSIIPALRRFVRR